MQREIEEACQKQWSVRDVNWRRLDLDWLKCDLSGCHVWSFFLAKLHPLYSDGCNKAQTQLWCTRKNINGRRKCVMYHQMWISLRSCIRKVLSSTLGHAIWVVFFGLCFSNLRRLLWRNFTSLIILNIYSPTLNSIWPTLDTSERVDKSSLNKLWDMLRIKRTFKFLN
jgi:hypothetical protein